tara:strand:- start:273 stop:503 length:231 start_codon:yes stop_codon:yes gene_type:complete
MEVSMQTDNNWSEDDLISVTNLHTGKDEYLAIKKDDPAILISDIEELMERIKGRDSSDNLIIYKGTLYLAQNIDLE